MKKILVTTDLSVNSKTGLRFAIQLASQNNYQLTFLHVYRILRPTSWGDAMYASFEIKEEERMVRVLNKFVSDLFKDTGFSGQQPNCVVQKGASSAKDIMQYAEGNGYDFICASRNGIGRAATLFGSTISTLIKKSNIPVIAVPKNYKQKPVTRITYVSDLLSIETELKKVVDFAGALHATVELLHFKVPMDYLTDPRKLENITDRLKKFQITTRFDALNYEETLIKNMNKIFKKTKPSMVIMFTKQKRNLFEKLFLSSITAEYALISKTPLLIFRKSTR